MAEQILPTAAQQADHRAKDLRIGREAMPISEVSLMMRSGYSEKAILADIRRRHIPEKINVTTEENFSAYGASPDLIAALKDRKNILTKNQKRAYDEQLGGRTTQRTGTALVQSSQMFLKSPADLEEQRRQENLQQQQLRNAEHRQAEQAAREREQESSVADQWRSIKDQNASREKYGTTTRGSGLYH